MMVEGLIMVTSLCTDQTPKKNPSVRHRKCVVTANRSDRGIRLLDLSYALVKWVTPWK